MLDRDGHTAALRFGHAPKYTDFEIDLTDHQAREVDATGLIRVRYTGADGATIVQRYGFDAAFL